MKDIKLKILIITLSDRASSGEYLDKSGPRIKELTEEYFIKLGWVHEFKSCVMPDNPHMLNRRLEDAKYEFDIIFTTGGTGIGPRDITPEVVKPLLDKEIPGVMEMIRIKYGSEMPNALLSRGVAGVMGNSLVYTLPGSLKAVDEYMKEIFKTLEHAVYMQRGIDVH